MDTMRKWIKKQIEMIALNKRRNTLINNRRIMLEMGFPLVIDGRDKNAELIKEIDDKLSSL